MASITLRSGSARHRVRAALDLSGWRTHASVAGLALLPAAVALIAAAAHAPLRTSAGLYFLVVLVPGLQIVVATFLGWRAAAVSGVLISALTLWQVVTTPRALVAQPVQWTTSLTAAGEQYRSLLLPPARPRLEQIIARGGKATLQVCLGHGTGEDLAIELQGHALAATARPASWNCWLELAVPPEVIPDVLAGASSPPLVVAIKPAGASLPAAADRSVIIGGYTRPVSLGGQSGGAAYFDGREWRQDDLSPLADGAQQGRLFVELRVFDAAGRLAEIWY